MLHVQHLGPVHWPTGHLPAPPPESLLAIVLLVELVVLAVELVVLVRPALLDPPWIPTPTVLPDPWYPDRYA